MSRLRGPLRRRRDRRPPIGMRSRRRSSPAMSVPALAARVVERARSRRDAPSPRRPSVSSSPPCSRRAIPAGTCARPSRATRRSSSWSGSTAPARPRRSASSPTARRAPAGASCWRRPIPFGPRRSTSSGSGRTAPARSSLPTPRAPTPGPSSTTPSTPRSPGGADVVIADTAGRLHTKTSLMDELAKIRRVVDRRLPGADPGDALRARRDDRPERPGPGHRVPRGRRAQRDRPDEARIRRPAAGSSSRSRISSASPSGSSGSGRGSDDLLPFEPGAVRGGPVRSGRRVTAGGRRRAVALAAAAGLLLAGCLVDAPSPSLDSDGHAGAGPDRDGHGVSARANRLVRRPRPDLRDARPRPWTRRAVRSPSR